jgi:hypothetical protein
MIYLITSVFSTLFFFLADKALLSKLKVTHIFFVLIALLFPSILAGCRDLTVGTDTLLYMVPYFQDARYCGTYSFFLERHPQLEPLYGLLVYVIASCTDNVAWFLFFQQFIVILLVYISAYKLRKNVPIWFPMAIYFLVFFHLGMNIIRQMLALSFCLISFVYLLKRNCLKSFILYLPALGFHSTAFIYLLVYPIYYLAKKRAVSVLWFYVGIGLVIFIISLMYMEDFILFFISQEILPPKMSGYTVRMNLSQYKKFSASEFIYYLIAIIIIQYSHKKNKNEVELFLIFKHLLLLCVILSPLGWFVESTANRCLYYFSFLSIVFLPSMLYNTRKQCISYVLSVTLVSFLLFFWFHVVVLGGNSYFPYTSKILSIH